MFDHIKQKALDSSSTYMFISRIYGVMYLCDEHNFISHESVSLKMRFDDKKDTSSPRCAIVTGKILKYNSDS